MFPFGPKYGLLITNYTSELVRQLVNLVRAAELGKRQVKFYKDIYRV